MLLPNRKVFYGKRANGCVHYWHIAPEKFEAGLTSNSEEEKNILIMQVAKHVLNHYT